MNVLYIDHYAGSNSMGMEFRPFYLAKLWKKMGINTTILAADFSHLRKSNPEISNDLEEKTIEGVPFTFIKTRKYEGNGVQRILSMYEFVRKGRKYANELIEKYNPQVVITSSTYPMDTYIGQLIKRKTKAILIHEIHDLWPLSPMILGGYSKWHPFIMLVQQAEISAYKNADYIVSILPNTEPYIRSLGISTPVINIPNGLMEEELIEDNKEKINKDVKEIINTLHSDGKFIVGYSGGISVSNAMDDFINAMILLKDNDKIASVIIGKGILKDKLQEIKSKSNLANVYFVDSIEKRQVIPTLSLMDALYIGSKKSDLYNYGVSANKIFDYLLAGKPIVNAFYTEHSPLNYVGNTIRAEAENPKSIAEAIIEASKLTEDKKKEIEKESKEYVLKNHDYRNLSKEFAQIFKK